MGEIYFSVKKGLLKNITFMFYLIFSCLVIFLIGEILCRLFVPVNFLGTSKNLLISNPYGKWIGNAKNTEAISFGVKIYTDENGFRVPPGAVKDNTQTDSAILILGDSVAFGCGVREDKTIAGLLRKSLPSMRIFNSAVIGYKTEDYRTMITNFLPYHGEIKQVYLVLCLNDIDPPLIEYVTNLVHALKRKELNNKINYFLGLHSKLYITIRGILTDPSQRYWWGDYGLFMRDKSVVLEHLQPIADVSSILKKKRIPFTVIICPYEFQVRNVDPTVIKPNIILHSFFKQHGISYIDALEKFRSQKISSKALFLGFDPMHFSERGHRIIYEIIYNLVRQN